MVPLLAPLLGSMAASLLPATFGTGIAAALGMSGAGAGLIAAAAPKAIGAGIGTLLAGGDMGEAALNAVGFGAAGAAMGGGAGAATAGSAAPATSLRPMMRPAGLPTAAATPAVPTAAANTAAATAASPMKTAMDTLGMVNKVQGALGGNQAAPAMAAPQPTQQGGTRASENPMLASVPGPAPAPDIASMTVPSVGGPAAMPASVGIGTLPFRGQQPMSNDMMMAGMAPDQRNMANQYLRNQGMVGFV